MTVSDGGPVEAFCGYFDVLFKWVCTSLAVGCACLLPAQAASRPTGCTELVPSQHALQHEPAAPAPRATPHRLSSLPSCSGSIENPADNEVKLSTAPDPTGEARTGEVQGMGRRLQMAAPSSAGRCAGTRRQPPQIAAAVPCPSLRGTSHHTHPRRHRAGATHWGQQVFYVQPPVECAPGDKIAATIEVTRKPENHRLLRVAMSIKVGAHVGVPSAGLCREGHAPGCFSLVCYLSSHHPPQPDTLDVLTTTCCPHTLSLRSSRGLQSPAST